MDISAPAVSLADRPRTGHLGHQGSQAPGRPAPCWRAALRSGRVTTFAAARSRRVDRGRRRGINSCQYRCPSWQRSDWICWTWLCSFDCQPLPASRRGGAAARPDHPIRGHSGSPTASLKQESVASKSLNYPHVPAGRHNRRKGAEGGPMLKSPAAPPCAARQYGARNPWGSCRRQGA